MHFPLLGHDQIPNILALIKTWSFSHYNSIAELYFEIHFSLGFFSYLEADSADGANMESICHALVLLSPVDTSFKRETDQLLLTFKLGYLTLVSDLAKTYFQIGNSNPFSFPLLIFHIFNPPFIQSISPQYFASFASMPHKLHFKFLFFSKLTKIWLSQLCLSFSPFQFNLWFSLNWKKLKWHGMSQILL